MTKGARLIDMEKTVIAFFRKHFTSEVKVSMFPETMIIVVNLPISPLVSATFLNQIKDYFDASEVQFQALWEEYNEEYSSEFTIFTRNSRFFY